MEATFTHPAPRQGRIAGRKARPLAAAAVLALAAGAAPLGAATLSGCSARA